MAFNPYSAGAKRYRGAGTAANAGRTLDPTGYIDRSATQRAAQGMMRQSGLNTAPSQSRSGLAAAATSRTQGQPIPPDKIIGGPKRPNDHGPLQVRPPVTGGPAPVTPIPPFPREPDPTWRLPARPTIPLDTSAYFEAERTPIIPSNWNPPDEITGGPALPPPVPDQGMPINRPVTRFNPTNTGRNLVRPTITAPPGTTPAAPNVKLPKLPKFANMGATLEADLRAQRNSGFASLNDQIAQIQTMLSDLRNEYQTGLQGLDRERGQQFMETGADFGARGMLSGSGYGQAYTDLTRDFTDQRNEMDRVLGQGNTQVLQSRNSAVTAFQNLLNELFAEQTQRNAQKAANKAKK